MLSQPGLAKALERWKGLRRIDMTFKVCLTLSQPGLT